MPSKSSSHGLVKQARLAGGEGPLAAGGEWALGEGPFTWLLVLEVSHDDIGEAAGRNDVHHGVSDVFIMSINHWVEMQHSRAIVLSRPLF